MSRAADEWVNGLHVGFTGDVLSDSDSENVDKAVDALVTAFAKRAPMLAHGNSMEMPSRKRRRSNSAMMCDSEETDSGSVLWPPNAQITSIAKIVSQAKQQQQNIRFSLDTSPWTANIRRSSEARVNVNGKWTESKTILCGILELSASDWGCAMLVDRNGSIPVVFEAGCIDMLLALQGSVVFLPVWQLVWCAKLRENSSSIAPTSSCGEIQEWEPNCVPSSKDINANRNSNANSKVKIRHAYVEAREPPMVLVLGPTLISYGGRSLGISHYMEVQMKRKGRISKADSKLRLNLVATVHAVSPVMITGKSHLVMVILNVRKYGSPQVETGKVQSSTNMNHNTRVNASITPPVGYVVIGDNGVGSVQRIVHPIRKNDSNDNNMGNNNNNNDDKGSSRANAKESNPASNKNTSNNKQQQQQQQTATSKVHLVVSGEAFAFWATALCPGHSYFLTDLAWKNLSSTRNRASGGSSPSTRLVLSNTPSSNVFVVRNPNPELKSSRQAKKNSFSNTNKQTRNLSARNTSKQAPNQSNSNTNKQATNQSNIVFSLSHLSSTRVKYTHNQTSNPSSTLTSSFSSSGSSFSSSIRVDCDDGINVQDDVSCNGYIDRSKSDGEVMCSDGDGVVLNGKRHRTSLSENTESCEMDEEQAYSCAAIETQMRTKHKQKHASLSEINYQGTITRRLGQMLFELDGNNSNNNNNNSSNNNKRLSLILTHNPVQSIGRGLRVGATVAIYNALPIYRDGKLEGLGVSTRSHVRVTTCSQFPSNTNGSVTSSNIAVTNTSRSVNNSTTANAFFCPVDTVNFPLRAIYGLLCLSDTSWFLHMIAQLQCQLGLQYDNFMESGGKFDESLPVCVALALLSQSRPQLAQHLHLLIDKTSLHMSHDAHHHMSHSDTSNVPRAACRTNAESSTSSTVTAAPTPLLRREIHREFFDKDLYWLWPPALYLQPPLYRRLASVPSGLPRLVSLREITLTAVQHLAAQIKTTLSPSCRCSPVRETWVNVKHLISGGCDSPLSVVGWFESAPRTGQLLFVDQSCAVGFINLPHHVSVDVVSNVNSSTTAISNPESFVPTTQDFQQNAPKFDHQMGQYGANGEKECQFLEQQTGQNRSNLNQRNRTIVQLDSCADVFVHVSMCLSSQSKSKPDNGAGYVQQLGQLTDRIKGRRSKGFAIPDACWTNPDGHAVVSVSIYAPAWSVLFRSNVEKRGHFESNGEQMGHNANQLRSDVGRSVGVVKPGEKRILRDVHFKVLALRPPLLVLKQGTHQYQAKFKARFTHPELPNYNNNNNNNNSSKGGVSGELDPFEKSKGFQSWFPFMKPGCSYVASALEVRLSKWGVKEVSATTGIDAFTASFSVCTDTMIVLQKDICNDSSNNNNNNNNNNNSDNNSNNNNYNDNKYIGDHAKNKSLRHALTSYTTGASKNKKKTVIEGSTSSRGVPTTMTPPLLQPLPAYVSFDATVTDLSLLPHTASKQKYDQTLASRQNISSSWSVVAQPPPAHNQQIIIRCNDLLSPAHCIDVYVDLSPRPLPCGLSVGSIISVEHAQVMTRRDDLITITYGRAMAATDLRVIGVPPQISKTFDSNITTPRTLADMLATMPLSSIHVLSTQPHVDSRRAGWDNDDVVCVHARVAFINTVSVRPRCGNCAQTGSVTWFLQCCLDDGSGEAVMTAKDELAWQALGLTQAMAKQVEGAVMASQLALEYFFTDVDTDAQAQAKDEKENGARWVWKDGEMQRQRIESTDTGMDMDGTTKNEKPETAYDLLAKFVLANWSTSLRRILVRRTRSPFVSASPGNSDGAATTADTKRYVKMNVDAIAIGEMDQVNIASECKKLLRSLHSQRCADMPTYRK